MNLTLPKLDHRLEFPSPQHALVDPDGLLAFGGDLSVDRLCLAYSNGIFPWFSEGEPLLWWSPAVRGILELDNFVCHKSLSKLARSGRYRVTLNHAFEAVIHSCAKIPRTDQGTWITDAMIAAYIRLHKQGYSHSVEVWEKDKLVGGLYGVSIGRVFCGESMFHLKNNTSKLAFYYLVLWLKKHRFDFIDCQLPNPHLNSLGCSTLPRPTFLQRLTQACAQSVEPQCWQSTTVSDALQP
ncbi:leucyl/phenylalanyl-tRNA--protein transferase [Lacimicrobium alkaliphilum]|uniref:Leucyl/phenylalanyl-tRNA--protein transferase n=1 Tax=Lacimicrobium alkaliphilum TaxID=1526571 RepID=A0ABQ1R0B1_9ALTE|nr:leucyl/phenylalanyl-tRNA--protein transferase [Lacimicrobium alkaliphilum]GGD53646.1 leucyl/phenylalanyl-tRNA--protein transferase [Lacimicrobium alkaliphilum]